MKCPTLVLALAAVVAVSQAITTSQEWTGQIVNDIKCDHDDVGISGAIITTAQECANARYVIEDLQSGPSSSAIMQSSTPPPPGSAAASGVQAVSDANAPTGCYTEGGAAKLNSETTAVVCSSTYQCYCMRTKPPTAAPTAAPTNSTPSTSNSTPNGTTTGSTSAAPGRLASATLSLVAVALASLALVFFN